MNRPNPLARATQPLVAFVRRRIEWARTEGRSVGASAVEWVIIAAIVVGICIAVAGILKGALVGKAGDISKDVGNQ